MRTYLQDNEGNDSSMRVAFWYGILWSTIFTTVYSFIEHLKPGEIVAMFSGLSASFFAMKLIQKKIEKKKQ